MWCTCIPRSQRLPASILCAVVVFSLFSTLVDTLRRGIGAPEVLMMPVHDCSAGPRERFPGVEEPPVWANLTELIVVAGHSVFIGRNFEDADQVPAQPSNAHRKLRDVSCCARHRPCTAAELRCCCVTCADCSRQTLPTGRCSPTKKRPSLPSSPTSTVGSS